MDITISNDELKMFNIKVRARAKESVIEACERFANVYTHGMARSVVFYIKVNGEVWIDALGKAITVIGRPY